MTDAGTRPTLPAPPEDALAALALPCPVCGGATTAPTYHGAPVCIDHLTRRVRELEAALRERGP